VITLGQVGVGGAADAAATILLWSVLALYLAGDLYWSYEILRFGLWYDEPSRRYGPSEVQVRVLTVGNEPVVRDTVRRIDGVFDDIHVVTEEPIAVPGADVRVVPESFECEATNKGRALEWARRTIPCDREFVLFLDEDSHVVEFGGLPDADIVQLNEFPRETTSRLTYFCEINRIGFQVEQRAFGSVPIPLYAWGGGIAVRSAVEDEVTWNYPTVIEDTAFVWRAFTRREARTTFAFLSDRVSNQAPTRLRSMFRQRRRWIAGSREDNDLLSLDRVLMYGIRDLSWSVTGVVPLLLVVGLLPGVDLLFADLYRAAALVLLGFMYVWIGIGIRRYRPGLVTAVAVLVLAPVTTVLHSVGAFWGLVSPPTAFEVTEKAVEGSPGPRERESPAADEVTDATD
jgi:hypothetical protein